jgi:predicted amidophosphoribosyltransferase
MRLISAALEQILPESCLHCRERVAVRGLLCETCGKTLRRHDAADAKHSSFSRHHALYYEGAAKALFSAAKFSNRRRALQALAPWAATSLQKLNAPESCFIEMPSSRPFLHRLVKQLLPNAKVARKAFTFEKSRTPGQNKLLKEAERFRRIAETLKLNAGELRPAKTYILCDDVFTTGATLGHAAWLLQTALSLQPEQIQLWTIMYRERLFEDAAD